MKKNNLVNLPTVRMSPRERQMGRFLRGPDGHVDDSGAAADNGAGNGDPAADSDSGADNGVQDTLGATFWNEPVGGDAAQTDADNSNRSDPSAGDNSFGQVLQQELTGMQFPELFTDSIAEQMNEGNFEGVNKIVGDIGRQATQSALVMSARLMQRHGQQMEARFQQMVEERFGAKDTEASLSQEFASYKDPAMRPQIDAIFNQSMKHAKGNRAEAIKMTKDMLRIVGKTGASDMGLDTPPQGRGDDLSTDASRSLVRDLLQNE